MEIAGLVAQRFPVRKTAWPTPCAPAITRRLIQEFARRPGPSTRAEPEVLTHLSPREKEIIVEVAGGWSNGDIGERLHISGATAKTHVGRLLMRLQAHDRAQLVMMAYETGLVTPSIDR